MPVVGRNSPCACGSGKKYKRCCEPKVAEMRKSPLPPGRFRYESGSYGGPGGYMPSIVCYKETGPDSWVEHFCLVKPDAIFHEEDSASQTAEKHITEARALMDTGGNIRDFALSLRHKGYKSVSDFSVIRDDREV
jgi:uncharacterized protein YecA (UPF0149 family)